MDGISEIVPFLMRASICSEVAVLIILTFILPSSIPDLQMLYKDTKRKSLVQIVLIKELYNSKLWNYKSSQAGQL